MARPKRAKTGEEGHRGGYRGVMRVSLMLVAAVLVVACADPGDTATTVASVPPPSGTESPTTTHPVTPGTIPPFTAVEVSSVVGALGEHLVDAEGRSLYM